VQAPIKRDQQSSTILALDKEHGERGRRSKKDGGHGRNRPGFDHPQAPVNAWLVQGMWP
jgi:hypothetical protein